MPPERDERELARALLSRGEDERRRILDQARTEATALLEEADSQVRALGEERLRVSRERARQEIAVRRSRVRVEQAGERARLLEDAVGRVLERARARLDGARKEPSYAALMARLARECLDEFPDATSVRLCVDPRDKGILEFSVPVESVESGGTLLGGVQAVDVEGALLVDNTFEARLAARASELRLRLWKIFSDTSDG